MSTKSEKRVVHYICVRQHRPYPTATTTTTSFHGTSVSIFQHPNFDNAGEERSSLKVQGESKVKKVPELPEAFTNVSPTYIATKPTPPTTPVLVLPAPESFKIQLKQEFAWLEVVGLTAKVDNNISVTWSAHHATQKRGQPFKVSIASLLPLLRDEAHSIATIKHVLEKIKETVQFLNPGQTPVVAADQPLYSLAKQIQWQWPEYGEDKVVMMLGGLHMEMAALKSIGSLLQDSGWTSALVEAGVASSGTAESYLSASSVTRARQAHQITACCLYKQRKAAYNSYSRDASQSPQNALDFEEWCKKRRLESPQFAFWDLVLALELTILTLIRSFREADFCLYREALAELLPYFLQTTM